jgi:hypothetical protein
MTVYVRRNGVLVDKETGEPIEQRALAVLGFPTPRISRFVPYESPVTGDDVTSWGQRDREMRDHNCFDPRDLGPDHQWRRGRKVQLQELKEIRANGREPE